MTVADYDYPVLVGGETGTGKELVARAIHAVGPRAAQPFVTVECTSIPRDLFESTLFGSERGAYSGAVERRRGLLQVAGRGTVFLDEIGDMPLEQQAKLLGAIERREFRPVGAELPLRFEGRFVAASHRDLAQLVREDRFRADLFHRLFVFRILVPPLRERRDEIRQLAVHFLEKHRGKGRILRLSEGAARELSRRDYHGNIRELERCLMRAIVRARGGSQLLPEHLDPEETGPVASGSVMSPAPSALTGTPAIATPVVATVSSAGLPDYEEARREYLKTVLRRSRGNVVEASRIMGKPATSVHALIRKLGLHEFLKECRRR